MSEAHDLIGIGIGPFNLSLAALSAGIPNVTSRFFEMKDQFEWHSELVFDDASMQTTYLKDLVTPVDPTNPYSFLNYLVQNRRFYAFLNTNRKTITREEFEDYCRFVSKSLSNTHFSARVKEVEYDGQEFVVRLDNDAYRSKSVCIGTGLKPSVPEFTKPSLGKDCFHAKSVECRNADWTGKRVIIVGGGQTGSEIFLNGLRGLWGNAQSITWISRRLGLEALDESSFANDYFTPHYVNRFFDVSQAEKERVVSMQKLTSDGITPTYLEEIYRELYLRTHVRKGGPRFELLTARDMLDLNRHGNEFKVTTRNFVRNETEEHFGDVVVLATGFKNELPQCVEPILPLLQLDAKNRPVVKQNFQIASRSSEDSRVYAVNFSRHSHGIAEPQTSLMAWRSATIINDLLGRDYFESKDSGPAFLQH